MKDIIIGTLGGILIGMAIFAFGSTVYIPAIDALIECEKDLPRNQNCKIIAVVDKND